LQKKGPGQKPGLFLFQRHGFLHMDLIRSFAAMKAGKQISLGFSSYTDAVGFIFKHGLWVYYFYPIILSLLLFIGGAILLDKIALMFTGLITSYFGLDDPDSKLLSFVGGLVSFFISAILWVVFFYIKGGVIKYVTLIILSPVLAHVSAKTEQLVTGKTYPFVLSQFMKDVLRGILLALRNMLLEFGIIFIFLFVSFLPGIGWLLSLAALSIVSWFFFGFSMMDYSNERKKLSISASTGFSWDHKWLCITNGFCFWLLFTLPWLGVVLGPVTSVVAATLAVNKVNPETIN
jgi:CysZ protein